MPEVPALPRGVAAVFAPGGPLSLALDGFEARPAQLQMAAAVADVFADGGILLAEAGTGTGKTLAYLVPAILSRERVLISTGTKNLQEQIFFKDIPALREAEMDKVGEFIARVLASPDDDGALGRVKVEVEALCRKFPLYPEV